MAYLSKDLSVIAYANGFTLWHYTTPDKYDAVGNSAGKGVLSPGYFNPAVVMLRAGDIIMANMDTAGTHKASLLLVLQSSGDVVRIHDMASNGRAATNSDEEVGA